jgi:hypothetical protein
MSRMSSLLREAADALNDGRDPLTAPFLDEYDVTLDECYDLAGFLAIGAQMVAWAMDNPKVAVAAIQGAKMQEWITLMQRAGWGES